MCAAGHGGVFDGHQPRDNLAIARKQNLAAVLQELVHQCFELWPQLSDLDLSDHHIIVEPALTTFNFLTLPPQGAEPQQGCWQMPSHRFRAVNAGSLQNRTRVGAEPCSAHSAPPRQSVSTL